VPEADVQGGQLDLQGDPAVAAGFAGEDRAVEFLSGVKQFGGVWS
jgi:hypothetical protein